jgi:hypothetical protein
MCLLLIASWPAAGHTAVDLQVEASAFAVVCRRSSTSDGLATAWADPEPRGRGVIDVTSRMCRRSPTGRFTAPGAGATIQPSSQHPAAGGGGKHVLGHDLEP